MEHAAAFTEDEVSVVAFRTFGVEYLYPWQRLVIANVLDAAAASDDCAMSRQIVLLPTGAGKSLCFLVPAVLLDKLTLVVYPLLSLMADQKRRMDEAGVRNVVFKGGMSNEEREKCFEAITDGAKVIIANPEILQDGKLVDRIARIGIAHFVIDEAHCICEWGDSFRPAYLSLGKIARRLHADVVTAFTATASEPVLLRIQEILFEGEAHIVRGDCDRPNIFYSVVNACDKKKMALRLALSQQKPLLIFCGTRSKAEGMARELAPVVGEDAVRFYHAGLKKSEKTAIETWFYGKQDGILCATCAYGMGIDKKDIRTVVHLEASPTVESYMQESGRAGRDGKPSKAFLLWSYGDHETYSRYATGSRERRMLDYAESCTCRRQVLLDALGGELSACSGCDVCERRAPAPFAADGSMALRFIARWRRFYKRDELAGKLIAEFNETARAETKINVWEHSDMETILCSLEDQKLIRTCHSLWNGRISVTKDGCEILKKLTLPRQEPLHLLRLLFSLA